MGIIEALIIGAAIFLGLLSLQGPLDNIAVGIEQLGIKIYDAVLDALEDE
jgi:hypothetical protein